ncbi:MAG: hypothetical protein U0798_13080 [Gemmataceae bacterium]
MASSLPITPELIREFLKETLSPERMAMVEREARSNPQVMELIASEREAMERGDHSLGAIWQEHQLSCPTREQLGGYVIEVGEPDFLEYVGFHLNVIECGICQANLEDLKAQAAAKKAKSSGAAKPKRKK